jgi:uncharacterized membrane protein YbaN (DUF454 family)
MRRHTAGTSETGEGAPLARALWLLAGTALLGLAVLGALLPGLPTTVFAIGAAGCFARSSPPLEAWLLRQPRLGPAVVAWRAERAIPLAAKRLALLSMLGSGLLVALTAPTAVALGVGLCLVLSALYVLTRPEPGVELRA